jgi:hypothetical protein
MTISSRVSVRGGENSRAITLKMEAIHSSETSVNPGSTERHIPEDDIFHLCITSIGIAMGYGLEVQDSVPGSARDFSPFESVQTGSRAYQAPIQWVPGR